MDIAWQSNLVAVFTRIPWKVGEIKPKLAPEARGENEPSGETLSISPGTLIGLHSYVHPGSDPEHTQVTSKDLPSRLQATVIPHRKAILQAISYCALTQPESAQ